MWQQPLSLGDDDFYYKVDRLVSTGKEAALKWPMGSGMASAGLGRGQEGPQSGRRIGTFEGSGEWRRSEGNG